MINRPLRICVVGEWLNGLPDEGIHNFAQNLVAQWEKNHSVYTIKIGADLSVNRFFVSLNLRKMLLDIQPDIVFYISPSCAKFAALFRAKMLKMYLPHARILVVALQPVSYTHLERLFLSLLLPDGVFVQSPRSEEALHEFRCPVYFLPSGVDLKRFEPVEVDQKMALRKRYGVDENALVVLHVGHIRNNRNVQLLLNVAQIKDVQVLLVGSTSTPQDETLTHQLTQLGVRVVREFIPHIEEFYQLADVYFFPVISEHASIGVPLSVLEAMACNLPVITTRFGGLPQMFQEGQGLFYFDNETELPKLARDTRHLPQCLTRQMVGAYAWNKVAPRVLEMVIERRSPYGIKDSPRV